MHKRKYKSGTQWCIWRWTDVDSEYITRLHVIKTPFWAICLHWINKPDPEPWLHDHPVTFLSIILKGWYKEKQGIGILTSEMNASCGKWEHVHLIKTRKWFNFIKTPTKWDWHGGNTSHTICEVSPGGCLTLCLMGPKTREWGFYTDKGWMMWKNYYKMKYFGA